MYLCLRKYASKDREKAYRAHILSREHVLHTLSNTGFEREGACCQVSREYILYSCAIELKFLVMVPPTRWVGEF